MKFLKSKTFAKTQKLSYATFEPLLVMGPKLHH